MNIFNATDAATTGLDRLIGGKAANLHALGRTFPIPPWFAVTTEAFRDDLVMAPDLRTAIDKAVATLGTGRLAVRSSAAGEDGETASHAGQLKSFLNIAPAEVADHVVKVWQSAQADSVTAYRTQRGQGGRLVPAVLVQVMCRPEAAGIAFGCDPVTGDRQICVITATPGLGDALAGGEVDGVTYRVPRDPQGGVKGDDPLLGHGQLRAIEDLLRRTEGHFGGPQDMEWAIVGGQLHLLQARPVTALPASASDTVIWDNSNIVESYSGVTSPLTFSFARYVYAQVYADFCRLLGISERRIKANHNRFWHMLGYIRGHVYYHIANWYALLALFPGFRNNQAFMEQMMGLKTPLPEAMTAAMTAAPSTGWARITDGVAVGRAVLGLAWQQIRLPRTMRDFYARLDRALGTELEAGLDLIGLAQVYRRLEGQLLSHWDAPLINDFLCMIAFGVSRRHLQVCAGEVGLQYHCDVLIGQGNMVSAEPARLIRHMADMVADDAEAMAALCQGDVAAIAAARRRLPDFDRALDAYLDTFGDRCLQELKLESPTVRDDPAALHAAIGHMAGRTQPAAERPDLPALGTIIGRNPLRLAWVGLWLNWARQFVRQRENLRFERTRVFGRVRRIFLAIGVQLEAAGQLDAARDVFMLEVEEVLGFIEGTSTLGDLKGLAALRRAGMSDFDAAPAPPSRLTSLGAVGLGITAEAATTTDAVGGETLKGVGCCRGRIRGRVRVIDDPRSARLEPGEIMVARFTDPGWITLFVNAAGILVERGSLLSHSAIVAREMNIPAIVALDGMMAWLKTGDVVEMDGATGVVRKVDHD